MLLDKGHKNSDELNLYAIGGYNSKDGILDSIEKYSKKNAEWTVVMRFSKEMGIEGLKAH